MGHSFNRVLFEQGTGGDKVTSFLFLSYICVLRVFTFFVSTKFHFDETISLARLRRRSFDVPYLWKLCDYITYVILELHFWDLVQCLLISFCFGSEILKKNGPPQPPKKPKNPP